MATPKKSAAARGLGYRHRQQIERLKRRHVDGTPCWWCGMGMWGDANADLNWDHNKLSGDHSIARATGGKQTDRLMHLRCNAERGDGSKDHLRPALTGQPWRHEVDNRADWCRLDWWPTGGHFYQAHPLPDGPIGGRRWHYRRDTGGEIVRTDSLQLTDQLGCTCQGCHATWTPDQYSFLGRLIGCAVPAGVTE